MANPLDTIFYQRDEQMVPPSSNAYVKPAWKTAYFLNPCVFFMEGPKPEVSSPTISRPENRPLKVTFNGWRKPMEKWNSWMDRLCSIHGSTWKEAGIFEPIMASRYTFHKKEDLILMVAKKWCSETNTFIFKWGEVTISLEDLMMLGGYSVLGDSVLSPLETEELQQVEAQMNRFRLDFNKTKSKNPSHHVWINYFTEAVRDFEHEAFLSLWLSRFVFPTSLDTVVKNVFPIAIHLARGTRIALAPAVLATIYRDLSLLKTAIDDYSVSSLTLWAPFQFLQVWIWERFELLRPKPDLIKPGMPRLCRWPSTDSTHYNNLDLDLLGECFQWRPYTMKLKNWPFPKFYAEREAGVIVSADMDTEFVLFARWIRVGELVGMGCIEKYFPHRVAMQFGIDQDIPANVPRCNESPASAWNYYVRPIVDAELYTPARLFESDVTRRYAIWWNKSGRPQFTPTTSTGLPATDIVSSDSESSSFDEPMESSDDEICFKKRRMLNDIAGPPSEICCGAAIGFFGR